jgi:PAS domain S-box-containing protein
MVNQNFLSNTLHFDPSDFTILVLEDSKFINKVLYEQLSKYGYMVVSVFTIEEARKALRENHFDYCILDIYLPDGESIALFQNNEIPADSKAMIITTERDKQTREQFFAYGILDYFVKNDTFVNNIDTIHRLIEQVEQNYCCNILVIDDSMLVRKQIHTYLAPRNYQLHLASDAQGAQDMLKTTLVDLILLDLYLPDIDGSELLRILKKNEKFASIPILILSGTDDSSLISQVLKGGASDFLHKPFIVEQLLLKVDLWIDYVNKSKQLEKKQQLLQEYKEVVDSSSMVIKTDSFGDIIYTNSHFYKNSGYQTHELLGKNINDLRAPGEEKIDMRKIRTQRPKLRYCKNQNKQGQVYQVSSIIHPIFDNSKNLIETIILEHDISDIMQVKDHLKDQLHINSNNFKTAYTLTNEYQHAIDESTIVSRSDISGLITYVNESYCEITGYRKEDILGNIDVILQNSNKTTAEIKRLELTLSHGDIYRTTISNVRPNGEEYTVSMVITPLKDANNNIIEYITISHDISEISTLNKEISETQSEILYRMGEIAEARSQETGNHVKRVAEYSKLLAGYINLPQEKINLIFQASPMHDIGKVAIADNILNKPAKLTLSEWTTMQTHSQIGHDILASSSRPLLQMASLISLTHHEKFDGTGYPNALIGKAIPIEGRIVAMADVFDALSCKRCYKEAWEFKEILAYFKEQSGKHFDPELVKIFFTHIHEFMAIKAKYA